MKENDRANLADELEFLAKSENQEQLQKEPDKAPPPPPKPYNVFGTDLTVTKAEYITYQKYRMKIMKMKYKLVGHVDENGQYVIPDLIRRDLVNMEKEIEDQNETYYKAIALYMKKHFYYSIRLQSMGGGTARASLYLSEFVDDFLGHEFIVTHIADFDDVDDDEFRIKLRKAFHLVDVATKVDDFAVPELAVIMQDAFDFELIAGNLYDMASQIYVMKMLKELEEGGGLCKEVLAKYRQLLNSKNIEVDEKFRYTSYKALLDRIIDEYGGFDGIGLDPVKVSAIVREMNKTLYQVDQASMRGPLEMQTGNLSDIKKADEKKAGKKPAAKKPEVKKEEKKKDDKKKDDKKKEEEKKSSSSSGTIKTAASVGIGISEDLTEFFARLEAIGTAVVDTVGTIIQPISDRIQRDDIGIQMDTGDSGTSSGDHNEKFNLDELLEQTTEIPTKAVDSGAATTEATEKHAAATRRAENEQEKGNDQSKVNEDDRFYE